MKLTLPEYKDFMENKPLFSMLLNATNQCNLRCSYCFTHHNPAKMSIDVAKRAIEFGFDHKNPNQEWLSVCWFGGEPMLEYERLMLPIMEWTEQSNIPIKYSMTTNLTLLSKERFKELEKHKVEILCSIDGPEQLQNACRKQINGKGSWELVKDNLLLAAKYPFTTGFRSTITPETCENLFESYKCAVESGFHFWFGGPDIGNSGWTQEKMDALERELFYISMDFYEETFERGIDFVLPQLESNLVGFSLPWNMNEQDAFYNDKFNRIRRCGLGTTSIGVTPEGNIMACQEHSTYKDIMDDPFYVGDIFNGFDEQRHISLLNNFIEDVTSFAEKVKRSEKCKTCNCQNSCRYSGIGCPSNSFGINKEFQTMNTFWCEYQRTWRAIAEVFFTRAVKEGKDIEGFIKFIKTTRREVI